MYAEDGRGFSARFTVGMSMYSACMAIFHVQATCSQTAEVRRTVDVASVHRLDECSLGRINGWAILCIDDNCSELSQWSTWERTVEWQFLSSYRHHGLSVCFDLVKWWPKWCCSACILAQAYPPMFYILLVVDLAKLHLLSRLSLTQLYKESIAECRILAITRTFCPMDRCKSNW